MRFRGLLVLVLAGALAYGAPAGAARKLVSHRGLTAYMPNDFACAEQVTIFVTGARSAFQGEKLGLQRLTGGVRATLGFECSEPIRTIVFIGVSGKQEVWRGLAAESNDWVLVDLASREAAAGAQPGAGSSKPATTGAAPAPVGNPVESLAGGVIRLYRGRTRTSSFAALP